MATEVDEQVKRLNIARQKSEEISREKSRLSGQLESSKTRLTELENKCVQDFECNIADLQDLIDSARSEAENSLAMAEYKLGLRADAPQVEEPPAPVQAPKVVVKAAPVVNRVVTPAPAPTPAPVRPVQKSRIPSKAPVSADNDGL